MYGVNSRLCDLEGEIGRVIPGAFADLLITDVDPLDDLGALADPEKTLSVIIARGRVIRDDLGA